MNYYQFHISDWALHTSHLSLEEEGVYRRLLDYYYDTEQPIPKKTQPVIRRLRLGSYEETVRLILDEFFILIDDEWHNNRADYEISQYRSKAESARRNGRKGGRPKKNSKQKQCDTKTENQEKTQPVILANPEKTGSKANQEPRTINQFISTNVDMSPDTSDDKNCPHTEIVRMYHELLPMCPRVREWTPERQRYLRTRWKENSERQDLDWWKRFFVYISESQFLTGKSTGKDGNSFLVDLEWIVRPKNFVKIIEGKYHRGAA